MSQRITVTVGSDGSITAESSGQSGPSCLDDYALILELLGGATVVDSRLTPGYFEVDDRAAVQATNQNWDKA